MNSEDELRLSYESILYDKNTELVDFLNLYSIKFSFLLVRKVWFCPG